MTTPQHIISSNGTAPHDFYLELAANNLVFAINDNPLSTTTNPINAGTWYHVAATYDGTTRNIYVNGGLVTSDTPGIASIGTTHSLVTIGIDAGATRTAASFSGLIDEAQIFNRALSGAEIGNIYTAANAGVCKGGLSGPIPLSFTITNPNTGTALHG